MTRYLGVPIYFFLEILHQGTYLPSDDFLFTQSRNLKLYVSFGKEPYLCKHHLQSAPIIYGGGECGHLIYKLAYISVESCHTY